LVAIGVAGIAVYFSVQPPSDESKKSLPSLPLSITELREPGEARYTGLYPNFGMNGEDGEKAAQLDPPFIGIGDVYISNTSLTRAVTLRLFLVIKDKDGKVTKLEGDGRGPMLRFMGRDDISTKFAQQRGLMPPKYILSPVSPHYAAR
jgi:hypothetical protein